MKMTVKFLKSPVLKYSIIVSVLLIGYFILLSFYDRHTSFSFSFFNSIIIGFGIYMAIRSFELDKKSEFKHQDGFKVGMFTGFLATFIHACFFTLYITKIDLEFPLSFLEVSFNPDLLNNHSTFYKAEFFTFIKSFLEFQMPALTGLLGFLVILIFGFGTSLLLTYIFVKYLKFKNPSLIKENKITL